MERLLQILAVVATLAALTLPLLLPAWVIDGLGYAGAAGLIGVAFYAVLNRAWNEYLRL
jgi:hypothetical protein